MLCYYAMLLQFWAYSSLTAKQMDKSITAEPIAIFLTGQNTALRRTNPTDHRRPFSSSSSPPEWQQWVCQLLVHNATRNRCLQACFPTTERQIIVFSQSAPEPSRVQASTSQSKHWNYSLADPRGHGQWEP